MTPETTIQKDSSCYVAKVNNYCGLLSIKVGIFVKGKF